MNRLIIIGNGFDLAHGLKTSYQDFIKWFLAKSLTDLQSGTHNPLFHVGALHLYMAAFQTPITPEKAIATFDELLQHKSYQLDIRCEVLSRCLERLKSVNWVDVENEYFLSVTRSVKKHGASSVISINKRFSYLAQQLKIYLMEQVLPEDFSPNEKMISLFTEEFRTVDFQGGSHTPARYICLLNFNYTRTADLYEDFANRILGANRSAMVINIHGTLINPDYPMIFGFGDEYDKNYLEFEDLNENELFRHIKSFAYLKTDTYSDLLGFLANDEYQVYIFGHSCGTSDRTMLRKILDSNRCKSVKIFYHQRLDGTNDFENKTFDLSRHFRDKEIMREKIVSFPKCQPMPQPYI